MSEGQVWERQWDLGETDKAWSAFEIYRDLPLHNKDSDKKRTLANVARMIGHDSMTMVGVWSSKYGWVERARAYDTHKSKLQLTVREAKLSDYQEHVYITEAMELSLLERTIHTRIQQTLDQLQTPDITQVDEDGQYISTDALELLRLTNAVEKLANMRRRLAQLPSNYKSDSAEREIEDGVYVITSD